MTARLSPRTLACALGALGILLTAVPPPVEVRAMDAYGGPLYAWPLVVLALGGALALVAVMARACPPLAALVVWMFVRTAQLEFAPRCLEVLAWTAAAALVVAGLARWPAFERWAVGALLVAAVINALVGALNLAGVYPLMRPHEAYLGRPAGFLRNPTYWGLYLALTLPLVFRVLARRWWRPFVTLAWCGLIVASYSAAAIGATAVVLLLRVWDRLALVTRHLCIALVILVGLLAVLLRPAPALLGGRAAYWQLTLEAWWASAPLLGLGPGLWLKWAFWEAGPIRQGVPGVLLAQTERYIPPDPFSEPIQLAFELGLVGLGIGAWLFGWTARQAVRAWRAAERDRDAWVLILVVAGLALWVTGLAHHGGLVAPVLVALAYVRRQA